MSAGLAAPGDRDSPPPDSPPLDSLPLGAPPLESLLWWREHVSSAPSRALRVAERWLGTAADPEVEVLARHVACLALVERGVASAAAEHAHRGVDVARRSGLVRREAQLRLTLAWVELDRGAGEASYGQLAAAEPHLDEDELARASCVRGLLHCQGDRFREAVAELSSALDRLHRRGDRHWAANALVGRGLAQHYLTDLESAEDDLRAAERLFAADGRALRAAACQHNRGCVAFRAGDLPRALRLFSDALGTGMDPNACPEARVDRAEALMAAGMHPEARAEMQRAAEDLAAVGRRVRLAETRLALAGCALREDDAEGAAEAALEACERFRAQDRPAWSALAAVVLWQARLRSGPCTRRALAAARKAATRCADQGWPAAAAELWLAAGRSAHGAGLRSASRELLARAAASGEQGSATVPQRVVGWLARALLARQDGDVDGVFEACGQGLRTVDTYAAAIPAYELRVQAFGLAEELAATAVEQALRLGDARVVLRWTERARASALSRRLPHPPEDRELRAALVELRAAVAAERDGGDRRAEILELEDRARQRAMLVDGATVGEHQHRGFEQLRARLGRAVLVTMFGHGGQLHVLSIVDGRMRVRDVGSEQDVQSHVDGLRQVLARQVRASPGRVRDLVADALAEVAGSVEQQLLGDLRAELDPDRPLVVVPTGPLHALPWAALPCCRGRSVTVAPSLRCWLRADDDARRARGNSERVWVAGPRLEHAEREVRALHGESGGQLITGAEAAVEAVLAAADGAGILHIAAHGEFRDDQPLLSALELADGPLYGYDLDRLHRGPATVVLSACEVGRSAVSRGDELSGLATALLGRGTATVIASIVPVSDERAAEVMLALHAGLRRGLSPAQALAAAQREHGETGFLCFGHGGDP